MPLPSYPFVDAKRIGLAIPGNSSRLRADAPATERASTPSLARCLDFRKSLDKLEHLGRLALLRAFREMGSFSRAGQLSDRASLKATMGIALKFSGLFDALLAMLQRDGFIQIHGQAVLALPKLDDPELEEHLSRLEEQKEHLAREQPKLAAWIGLLWPCLTHFPPILRGELPATDVLFPHSSMKRVEGIYKGSPIADFFNERTAQDVRSHIEQRLRSLKVSEKINILEVGAGTGGASEFILKEIHPLGERLSYIYTDVSAAFTRYGGKQFSDRHPFVEYRILDIEKEPEKQGFGVGEMDVVIGANVLHATRSIQNTLRNVKTLLRKNGRLVLNEITGRQDFLTLTFGLLDGWWLFGDPENRLKDSPLLDSGMWRRVLQKAGFEVIVGEDAPSEKEVQALCQNVMIGRSDGILKHLEHETTQTKVAPKIHGEWVTLENPNGIEDEVRSSVTEIVALVVDVDVKELNSNTPYTEFGVDSILGVEVIDRINSELSISLKSMDLFNYATIRDLSAYIVEKFGSVLSISEKGAIADPEPLTPARAALVHSSDYEPLLRESAPSSWPRSGEIAIIGIAGRFPGAENLDQFWLNLSTSKNSIEEIPTDRWPLGPFYDPDPMAPNRSYSKWGGFLSDIQAFDPLFFNISRKEAERMDPRQRLILQEAWKALEDAGYADRDLAGKRCGVYIGCGSGDYKPLLAKADALYDAYAFMGNASSILPSRISYFLNLKGPSLSVDTACSSSLVAIHLACEEIRNRPGALAIAGGVSILTTPEFHILAGKTAMLSPDGQCKVFDNRANGFTPGEGVGVVVLKSLESALSDGDHIYAVIKGTGVNQDGKTNGITAPNGPSQTALLLDVYRKSGVDPGTLGYMEAHGTGTKLGDPIEVHALTEAFEKFTDKKQYCAIGSVKTNIGHSLEAAGVAGLIKIILCLKHQKLVPTLNFKEANEHIHFEASPFYVSTRTKEWEAPEGTPRRAAISSFGFSGTNAHIVIEEHPGYGMRNAEGAPRDVSAVEAIDPADRARPGLHLIVLSTKTREAMRQKLIDFDIWLGMEGASHLMENISYTLIVGRSHFSIRRAFVVRDHEELKQKIGTVLAKGAAPGFFSDDLTTDSAESGPALKALGASVIREISQIDSPEDRECEKMLQVLADLYVKGYDLPWALMFKKGASRSISLPAYPFARESCRVTEPEDAVPDFSSSIIHRPSQILHPMVHRNTSDLNEQRFTSEFSGKEFFLTDHVINGQSMLPAAAYLEMGRFCGEVVSKKSVVRIRDIVWARPITAWDEPCEVHVSLFPRPEDSDLQFEIFTHEKEERKRLHARGVLNLESLDRGLEEKIDVDAIRKRCHDIRSGKACYRLFHELGLDYGPKFQGIESLFLNKTEALARLRPPVDFHGTSGDFVLHPTLLDGALQTVIGQIVHVHGKDCALHLPYSLGELKIAASVSETCWAHVKLAGDSSDPASRLKRYDIRLIDDTGHLLAMMRDLFVRPPRISAGAALSASKKDTGSGRLLLFKERWEDSRLDWEDAGVAPSGAFLLFDAPDSRLYTELERRLKGGKSRVVLVGVGERFRDAGAGIFEINPENRQDYYTLLKTLQADGFLPDRILHLWSNRPLSNEENELNLQLKRGVYSVFHMTQALMQLKPKNKIKLLCAHSTSQNTPHPLSVGMGGFARTVFQEQPNFIYKTVEWEAFSDKTREMTPSRLLDRLLPEFDIGLEEGVVIRFEDGKRLVRRLARLRPTRCPAGADRSEKISVLKEKGVYLITGGTGGLGRIFSEHLARRSNARLILTGRSAPGEKENERIRRLESLGAEAVYIQADVSVKADVDALVLEARERFDTIHGVIYAAGVNRDSFLFRKTTEEMDEVLASKVLGPVYLDDALKSEPLDFFALFSSTTSILGNVGQCDYAFGNGFVDGFVGVREELRRRGERKGRSLSINWPLWKEGGMNVDEALTRAIEERVGMTLLDAEIGVRVFEQVLCMDESRVMVIQGDERKIQTALGLVAAEPERSKIKTEKTVRPDKARSELPDPAHEGLRAWTERYLKEILSKETRTPAWRIRPRESFETYGVESVMIMNLNRELTCRFGELSKTLFFEYQNLAELTDYFLENHREKLMEHMGAPAPEAVPRQEIRPPDEHRAERMGRIRF